MVEEKGKRAGRMAHYLPSLKGLFTPPTCWPGNLKPLKPPLSLSVKCACRPSGAFATVHPMSDLAVRLRLRPVSVDATLNNSSPRSITGAPAGSGKATIDTINSRDDTNSNRFPLLDLGTLAIIFSGAAMTF